MTELALLRVLTQKPGELRRVLGEESTAIRTGKPRSPAKKKIDISGIV